MIVEKVVECLGILFVIVWCDINKFDESGKLKKVCNGVEVII